MAQIKKHLEVFAVFEHFSSLTKKQQTQNQQSLQAQFCYTILEFVCPLSDRFAND